VAALPVSAVLWSFVRNPAETFYHRWNWKSAVLSATTRATLFFVANLAAGPGAATRALALEFAYRSLTAGFYGAMTESLSRATPAWLAGLAAMVLLPAVAHTIEFVVHYAGGTPRLADSVAASIAFTACSTLFHLFAMRRGALIVGEGRDSLAGDLRRMPRLIAAFVLVALSHALRGLIRWPATLARSDRPTGRGTLPPRDQRHVV
jgi:hypothetical protein